MSPSLLLAHAGVEHDGGGWTFSPIATAYLAVLALGYIGLVARGWAGGRRPSRRRSTAWVAGIATIAIALMSPIDALAAERSLTMHTLQHELLLTVAPILLLLGLEPRLVAPLGRRLVPSLLPHGGTAGVLRLWTAPAFALVCWTLVVGAGSLPAVVEQAWRVEQVHYASHVVSLVAGLLLWAVVLTPYPTVHRIGVGAKLAVVACANVVAGLVAGILGFSPSVAYPLPYGTAESPWLGLDPLTDQRIAAGLMMAACMITTFGAAVWIVSRAPSRVVEGWQATLPAPAPAGPATHAGGARTVPSHAGAPARLADALDDPGAA